MESSLFVPITIWNGSQPTLRVSSVRITPNGRRLISSSLDGELFIWDVNLNGFEINPRSLLLGHSDLITCLECTDEYAVSASEAGEMCRWNLDDGFCTKSVQSVFVHRQIQLFRSSRLNDDLLFACGDYDEIFIIHSVFLETLMILHSKADSDWISCFYVMSSLEIGNDVVSAITKSSFIKLWIVEELSCDFSYEVQSSLLQMKNVSHIKCSLTQTQILVISDNLWTIFDAKYLKTICSSNAVSDEKFLGGDFFDSDVLIWTNRKKIYLFKLGVDGAILKMIFSEEPYFSSIFEPAVCYLNSGKKKFLIQCDVSGKISFWNFDGCEYENKPTYTCDLSLRVNVYQSKTFDRCLKKVTSCIAIIKLDLFAVGYSDGTIIVASASRTILSCNETESIDADCRTLSGHKDRINCLLYPHDKYSYHNKSHLLSGGSDFSVCLWDLSTYKLIHRFCVQSGEIIKFLIPPNECKQRIKNSVCSVANDHSIAILNLKELKCIVLASRQLFPVVTINWRPLDDFLIIECFDGTVYVWEMETGHLDRVLHGVTAQEVIYACKGANQEAVSNFYLREDSIVGRDHFRFGLFQVEKDFAPIRKDPVHVLGFRDSFNSENQIIAFNICEMLDSLCGKTRPDLIDQVRYSRDHALTQGHPTALRKPKEMTKGVVNGTVKDFALSLVSMLRDWQDNKIRKCLMYSMMSESQNVSVLLSSPVRTPMINTINIVALMALTSALEANEVDLNVDCELDVEVLAKLWQNRCILVRQIAGKLLLTALQSQKYEERSELLRRWFKYLPHLPTVDGTRLNKSDPEIEEMRIVAFILFGVIGADFKFKISQPVLEEMYISETCSALVHSLEDGERPELQVIAINMLGRGYTVWEPHLKFERIMRLLFEITQEYEKYCYYDENTILTDKCIFAHETLISIAIARTESFMNYETREIAQLRSSQSYKSDSAFMEKSKTEMILIATDLLTRTPFIMLRYLNEVVTVLLYCINPNHLKQEVIGNLISALAKFKQVHHCLGTQRIAVGLQDGSVAIHELKTFKMYRIAAHSEAVDSVSFSPDGKILATYCFLENKLSFWNVFSTMFGLGHVNIKSLKTYETNKIRDENVRNHFEIAQLAWMDNKSVILRLCNGTQTVYHV